VVGAGEPSGWVNEPIKNLSSVPDSDKSDRKGENDSEDRETTGKEEKWG
jgi:hypothetical protein